MVTEITVNRPLPANVNQRDIKLFEGALKATFYVLPPLVLRQAAIFQDTVFSPQHRKVYSQYTHVHGLPTAPIAKRVAYSALKSWRKIPHGMWIKDEWSANFFHWMTDCVPRIWQGLEFGLSDRVILPDSFKHLPYVTESLKMLNITPVYFTSKENLWVEELILTSRTSSFPNFNIPYILKTREKFGVTLSVPPIKKIYASRRYADKRSAHNVVDVELLMIKRGFQVVYFEKLNLQKQIELMAETKILVGLHGAALTNMIFMPAGQTVVELRNMNDCTSNCYFNLAATLGHHYYYTLNQGDHEDTIMANFTINLQALEEILDEIDK